MHLTSTLGFLFVLAASTGAVAAEESPKCAALSSSALETLTKDIKTGVDAGMGNRFFTAGQQIACENTAAGILCASWTNNSSRTQGGTLSEAFAHIDSLHAGGQGSSCGGNEFLTVDLVEEPCCIADKQDITCICAASGPSIAGRDTLDINEPACCIDHCCFRNMCCNGCC